MKAVVTSFERPLEILDVAIPEPGGRSWCASRPAACATPTSTRRTATGQSDQPPFIPGHEAVGVVEQVGSA